MEYISGSELTATVDINGGQPLPAGDYRFLVCGTTTIRDCAGNALDGDGNGNGGDDFERNFTVLLPPGVVGAGLQIAKSTITAGDLRLSWSPSCASGAVNYAIYEGTLGNFTSHRKNDCSDDAGNRVEEIQPQSASSYYLVVPLSTTDEGSYGVDSDGVERALPSAPNRCLAFQTLGGC